MDIEKKIKEDFPTLEAAWEEIWKLYGLERDWDELLAAMKSYKSLLAHERSVTEYWKARTAEKQEQLERAKHLGQVEHEIRELIAVMMGDGGHSQTEDIIADLKMAEQRYYARLTEMENMRYRLESLEK